uniref:Crp/Fnr family transcriptional regulator n=1 Tax=Heterorhabditis bacteriophora TaxID=37862 RepID=A0A1I7WA64_HETBA
MVELMSFFNERIRKLPERWQKVIESEGKYFDD